MAIQHLPRPWLLAALADVPVTLLARYEANDADADRREHTLPRAEARRRRLSTRPWADEWPGEDCWPGTDRSRDPEAERAN
jgi:hypothetical protein